MAFVTFYFGETRAKEKIEAFDGTPTWGVLELTRNCNLACRWCYTKSQGLQYGETMSKPDAFDIINILASSGVRQISITGGEPTLVPYLPELVAHITGSGMIANLNTNCFNMAEGLARKLARAGLNQVLTNLEGTDPKTHDRVRGREVSFEKTLRAIKHLRDNGIKVVVQTVVTTENAKLVPKIAELVSTLNVSAYRLWDVVGCEDIYPKNWVELIDSYADHLIKLGAKSILSYDPVWPTRELPVPTTHVKCPIEDGMMVFITPTGDIIKCSSTDREPICNILNYKRVQDIPPFKRGKNGCENT